MRLNTFGRSHLRRLFLTSQIASPPHADLGHDFLFQIGHGFIQVTHTGWLGSIVRCARCKSIQSRFAAFDRQCAEHNHGDVVIDLSNSFQRFDPVDTRHIDVQKDHVGLLGLEEGDRFGSVLRRADDFHVRFTTDGF